MAPTRGPASCPGLARLGARLHGPGLGPDIIAPAWGPRSWPRLGDPHVGDPHPLRTPSPPRGGRTPPRPDMPPWLLRPAPATLARAGARAMRGAHRGSGREA